MKKTILLILLALMFTTLLNAQTVLFHENFEAPSYGDSLITTADSVGYMPTTNFRPWATSTHLFNSGISCDSNTTQPYKTIYLTTIPFSTVGANNVFLQFSHICKLFFSDGGFIEVTNDNGITWHTLTVTEYQDSGTMIQNKFCENAYGALWLPGDTITKPTNSWWRTEHFDISSITLNSPNVKIRFRYYSTGIAQAAGRYGWLIDDVKVYQTTASQYTVTTIGYPTLGGTVSGAGTFSPNQIDTVVAIPNAGFNFFNWMESGITVSTNPVYVFNVNFNRHLQAYFSQIMPNCSASFMVIQDTSILHHYFVYTYVTGNAPFQYLWHWGDGTSDTISNPSHTFNSSGYYNINLKVTDAFGCISTFSDSSYLQKTADAIISMTVIPKETTGINVNEISNQIKIYPNPAINKLTIDYKNNTNTQNTIVFIYNLEGELLVKQTLKQSKTDLNISNLTKGMYIIKISNDNKTTVSKFVKE